MKHPIRRTLAILLALALQLSLVLPAAGAAPAEAADEITRTDLFTHDMVTDNPGEVGYQSMYNDPAFMTARGYDGMTFSLFEAAQYGLLWDTYDKEVNGITLTQEEYEAAPDDPEVQAQNEKKVFPFGSESRAWVEQKRADLIRLYTAAKEGGQKVYFMQDIIVLPNKLKTDRPDILTDGKIDIRKAETQTVMDYMYEEMFTELVDAEGNSLVDGIYVRYGETYTGAGWGIPYHSGNNPIMGDEASTHLILMKYLRDEICEKLDKEIIYRTWGFGAFQNNPATYLAISNQLEPHENFYFAVKHTAGDFHRTIAFNQCLNIGKHQQIVEVQAAREYEGKGAYPNYIGDGVINGYEEYEWSMSPDQNQSLRDVVNVEGSLIKGVWTWSRGGGWAGPYINGPGYPNDNEDDPYHDRTDKSIAVPNGSEMWDDLNAYVVTQWAKDTSKTDKELVLQYAKDVLGMGDKDAESFYTLCLKSARAVLLGRARDTSAYNVDVWWTRDDGINPTTFWNNINSAYKNDAIDEMLAEKAECVQLWNEMVEIAENLDDSLYEQKLIDSDTSVKDYIIMTTQYGRYLFSIFEQMHIAAAAKKVADETGTAYPPEMKQAVDEYERLWAEWQQFYEDNKDKGCPTLYAKTRDSLSNGLVYCSPLDDAMKDMRYSITATDLLQIGVGETGTISCAVSPYDVSELTYRSADEAIATVDENGTVTGVSAGTTRILVETADKVLSAATIVKVAESSSQTELLWSEDFSTDVSSGWSGATWNEEAQNLSVSGSNGDSTHTLSEPVTAGQMILEADLTLAAANQRCFFIVQDGSAILCQLDFRDTGILAMDQGNNNMITVLENYEAGRTYHITLTLDTITQQYTVQVDDNAPITLDFRNQGDAVTALRAGTRASGQTLTLDNLSIHGTVAPEEPTAQEVADTITAVDPIGDTDLTLSLPQVGALYAVTIAESSNPDVIALDGTITRTKEDQSVTLTFQVERLSDGTTARTAPLTVTVPAGYSAQDVADSITQVDAPARGATELTLPQVPEGFRISITSSSLPEVIALDGTIQIPDADTEVTLVFQVEKRFAEEGTAVTTALNVTVPGYSAQDAADELVLDDISVGDLFLTLPEMPTGFSVEIEDGGSIIAQDGRISPTGREESVDITLLVKKQTSDTVGRVTLSVTVPAYRLESYLADTFEDLSAGTDLKDTYVPNRNPDAITLTAESSGDGMAAKLVQASSVSGGSVLPTRTLATPAEGLVHFSGRIKVDASTGAYFIAYSAAGSKVAQIDFRTSGQVELNQTDTPLLLPSYETGRWYTFDVYVDFAAGNMDVSVDGTLVAQDIPLGTSGVQNIGRVTLGMPNSSANTVWYDDICVDVVNTEPVPPEQYTVTVKTQGEGDASAAPTAAAEGDTVTLTAQAAEGWHFVKWTSEDVTVSEEGTFQMPAKNVTVTAVFEQDVTDVKVASITVSAPADVITEAGGTLQMSAAVLPEDATDKNVTWSVTAEDGSDTALASIDGSGLLTAGEAEGVVKVVATANDGSGVTGEKLITIDFADEPVVTGVTVSPATASVQVGKEQQFNAVVEGENEPDQTVTWSVEGAQS
ncbi:Ig-like domain-containing protein, partial [Flavonifractor hominis]